MRFQDVIGNAPSGGGWIEVVCGPMFSGTSEELIRRLRRAEIAGQRVLIVKAGIDDRYDITHVVTHGGAKMRAVNVLSADEVRRFAEGYEVVGLDELHFFEDAIVDVCVELAERGHRVIVAGLDTDFRAEPFVAMPELMARAEFRRQVAGGLPPLRRPGHPHPAPRQRQARTVLGRHDPGRRARRLRSPLPCLLRAGRGRRDPAGRGTQAQPPLRGREPGGRPGSRPR